MKSSTVICYNITKRTYLLTNNCPRLMEAECRTAAVQEVNYT